MALKAKKEPPRVEAKTKALKAKKAVHTPSTFLQLWKQPRYPWKSTPRRNKLDPYAIIKLPLTTESAMKKTEDNNTLVFSV